MASKKEKARTIGILSYITIIGWFVAFMMHNEHKTKLGGFHIRQALLLHLVMIVAALLHWFLWLVVLVFMIIGLVSASQHQEKPVPLFGNLSQEWFKGL